MARKKIRFKLLLDENLPPRKHFKRLNNRHQVRHIIHDYHFKMGTIDKKVYDEACHQESLLITFNKNDFKKIKQNYPNKKTGIIALEDMSTDLVDKKLVSLLSIKKRNELYGYITTINN